MKAKKSLLSGYKITTDSNFIQSISPIPDYINNQLIDLHALANSGKKSSISKFLKLIDRFPKIAILKNYLSVSYQNTGEIQKAHEVNHWIVAEHPDYYFGKINLAAEYLETQQYDKIKELLGESLDIKHLLPKRKTFHIDEVTSFFSITAIYSAAIKDFKQADIRLEILDEINPDHLKTIQAMQYVEMAKLGDSTRQINEQQKDNIFVKVKATESGNKTSQPNFNNLGIYLLYKSGTEINQDHLTKILELPKDTLISDLEMILNDSIDRYHYFTEEVSYAIVFEKETSFAIHTIFLLGELDADHSLNSFFRFMKQDIDFYDFYLGDILTEYFWIALYKIANNKFDDLLEFIQLPGIYTLCKTAVSDVICQTALHQPERRDEAINWYKKALNFFINSKIDDNVIDSNLLGGLVGDILDIQGTELLPEIEELYSKNLVDLQSCGDIDEVKKIFNEDISTRKREVLSIFEIYDKIASWSAHTDSQSFSPITNEELDLLPLINKDVSRRNDPCPCGSGKKYKKCCMNK